jgi:hypothetical protein
VEPCNHENLILSKNLLTRQALSPYCARSTTPQSKSGVAYLNLGDASAKISRNVEARLTYPKYLQLVSNSKSVPTVKKKLEDSARTP